MNFFLTIPCRKYAAWMILELLAIGLINQEVLSQEVTPSFKITGEKRMEVFPGSPGIRTVEYDLYNPDHLIISYYKPKDVLISKGQFRFKGKKFNLSGFQYYLEKKELICDGIHQTFSPNQKVVNELIYKEDTLRQQTNFYPNGQKQMTFSGDEKALNGQFTMWHLNGKISFLGHYKNNLKDGEFESFDETGHSERKGTYREGKLIAGESVVQDLVYDAPEEPARYKDNDSIMNQVLAQKTAGMAKANLKQEDPAKVVDLTFTIDKTGTIDHVEITRPKNLLVEGIVHSVFNKEFEGFLPARIEGAPVNSKLQKAFLLSSTGLQAIIPAAINEKDSALSKVYLNAEQMPVFPGGERGFWNFIAQNVRYPGQAQEKKIQGKVMVSFIILEDGTVYNPTILSSVHPILDAEAIRVVKSMPRWVPAMQKGKAVRVSFNVPINFVLQK